MNAFLQHVSALLLDELQRDDLRSLPVVRHRAPEALEQLFRELGAALELEAQVPACDPGVLGDAVSAILEYSVRTAHPRFFNQNFAGADPIAVVGDWLGAYLNTTNATYEAAPIFTLMERALLQKLAALAGFREAEGLFCAGGSMSNLLALHLARHRANPELVRRGMGGSARLVAFTSAHSHYSLGKSMALLGLGFDALRELPCDARGRLLPEALRAAILDAKAAGERPFFLNATAGTTVTGAFDPIAALRPLAQEHDLWLHVDGCYGGSALFSPRHKQLLAGLEGADSMAWNLHKMMGITQQCSALLVAHQGLLSSCFATAAAYLFQPDKEHADLDSGDRHFQCARRVDVLKLWLTWRARGDEGFARRIDTAQSNAAAFEEALASRPHFALAYPRNFTNVCFWWLPPPLRGLNPRQLDPQQRQQLHAIAPKIKRELLRQGSLMLGFQSIDGLPNFFRMLFIQPSVDAGDIEFVLSALEACGEAAWRET